VLLTFSGPRRTPPPLTSFPELEMVNTGGVAASQLKAFVERIERLEEEKKNIADDIRDVFAEAKGQGFDTKVMRQVIRLRKKDVAERQEEEALLDLYLHALGMTPAPVAEAAE
jgi:uncharacterized protein (UPF0335 family)